MCRKSNFNFFKRLLGNKRIIFLSLLLLLIVIYTVPSIFAVPQPVKSVEIFSNELNYQNKDPGAWKITKSARWVRQGEVEVTLNVESILKTTEKPKDVLFVLDISGSMSGEKLTKVKSDAIELVESLLSNGKNRAGLISFGSTSEILTNLTTDKNTLTKKINDLEVSGSTNYYQALKNVDSVLKSYNSETGREFLVLFLTDGYPNVDTPSETGQYQYLKNQYPFLNINAIQYEMGVIF